MNDIAFFERELSKGRMSRRDFMVQALAAGLTVSAASALAGKVVQAAVAKRGGDFRVGVADFATTDSLDPRLLDTRMQLLVTWQLRNNLIEVGHGGALVPELAESWDSSADGKTWVFKLRKGVEFSNGKSLTPDDVIYTLNLHRAEDTKSAAKPFFESITELKASGPNELTVKLDAANRDFPALMSIQGMAIVPDGDTDLNAGIGTGGYRLEAFEPGVRSIVTRHQNYWKENRAHFDSVELIAIKDATARTTALISGEIHAFNFVELKTAGRLARAPGVNLLQTEGKAHYAFAARTDMAPYSSNDARLALKYGIDREDVVKRILNGYGSVGNDQPISGAYRFYNGTIPQRTYDPDKARFHAKKAGIAGETLHLHVSETPFAGATDMGVLYSEHLKNAGMNLEVVREPDDGYWNSVWAKKPFFATRWSGRVTEDAMLNLAYSAAALETGWNETFYNNPRLNSLLDDARSESDEDKRRAMYGEVQRIIHSDGGAVIPAFANFVDAVSDKVGYGDLASDWDLDGARCSERWWFKE